MTQRSSRSRSRRRRATWHTRKAACDSLSAVARIGTHIFHFADFIKSLGGWSRATRRAVSEWYNRPLDQVGYQVVKYRQRDGYTHRDILRLAHVKPEDTEHDNLFEFIVKGDEASRMASLPKIVEGYKMAQVAESPRDQREPDRGVRPAA